MHDVRRKCAQHHRADNEEYLNRGHVSIRFGNESSLAFEEWFLPRYGRQRRVECTVDQYSVTPSLVMGQSASSPCTGACAAKMAERFPVTLFPVPFEMQPLIEVMVWPRYLDEDPAHSWLRAAIETAASA